MFGLVKFEFEFEFRFSDLGGGWGWGLIFCFIFSLVGLRLGCIPNSGFIPCLEVP